MSIDYKKSIDGYQCIGPCYKKNTFYHHPIDNITLYSKEYNTCPITKRTEYNKITKLNDPIYNAPCLFPDKNIKEPEYDYIMISTIPFNSTVFIKNIYDLKTLEEFYKWLDINKTNLYTTKKRVFERGINVYSDYINIVDDRLVIFFIQIIKENMISLYQNVRPYLDIKNDTVYLTHKNKKYTDDNKNVKLFKTYIENTFLTQDIVHKYLISIIKYKDILKKTDVLDNLTQYLSDYIIEKIKITIS